MAENPNQVEFENYAKAVFKDRDLGSALCAWRDERTMTVEAVGDQWGLVEDALPGLQKKADNYGFTIQMADADNELSPEA